MSDGCGTPLTFEHLRNANEKRVKLWHPGGVTAWTNQDWMTALIGEVGEACQLVETPFENADEVEFASPGELLVGAMAHLGAAGDALKKLHRVRDKIAGNKRSTVEYQHAVADNLGATMHMAEMCATNAHNIDEIEELGTVHVPLTAEQKTNLAKELADVMIYLDLLALRNGINLAGAVIEKFNEVSDRNGFDVRL